MLSYSGKEHLLCLLVAENPLFCNGAESCWWMGIKYVRCWGMELPSWLLGGPNPCAMSY